MRALADAARVERFLEALGRVARSPARVYLTGGATAVLDGWRDTTVDVDLKLVPDEPELYRFPAIDTAAFRREVEAFTARATKGDGGPLSRYRPSRCPPQQVSQRHRRVQVSWRQRRRARQPPTVVSQALVSPDSKPSMKTSRLGQAGRAREITASSSPAP